MSVFTYLMQWIANIYLANHFSQFGFLQSYYHVVPYFSSVEHK